LEPTLELSARDLSTLQDKMKIGKVHFVSGSYDKLLIIESNRRTHEPELQPH